MSITVDRLQLQLNIDSDAYSKIKELIAYVGNRKFYLGTDELRYDDTKRNEIKHLESFLFTLENDMFDFAEIYDIIYVDEESYIENESVSLLFWEGSTLIITRVLGETIFKFNVLNEKIYDKILLKPRTLF